MWITVQKVPAVAVRDMWRRWPVWRIREEDNGWGNWTTPPLWIPLCIFGYFVDIFPTRLEHRFWPCQHPTEPSPSQTFAQDGCWDVQLWKMFHWVMRINLAQSPEIRDAWRQMERILGWKLSEVVWERTHLWRQFLERNLVHLNSLLHRKYIRRACGEGSPCKVDFGGNRCSISNARRFKGVVMVVNIAYLSLLVFEWDLVSGTLDFASTTWEFGGVSTEMEQLWDSRSIACDENEMSFE